MDRVHQRVAYLWTRENAQHAHNEQEDDEGDDDDEDEDPEQREYQKARSAMDKKLRVQHNKAYRYIRQHLSDKVVATTKNLNVRHLRNYWNDGTTLDKRKSRKEYDQLKLEDCTDFEDFKTAFDNKVLELRQLGVKAVADDEDVLYDLNEKLPAAWKENIIATGRLHVYRSASRKLRFLFFNLYYYLHSDFSANNKQESYCTDYNHYVL